MTRLSQWLSYYNYSPGMQRLMQFNNNNNFLSLFHSSMCASNRIRIIVIIVSSLLPIGLIFWLFGEREREERERERERQRER